MFTIPHEAVAETLRLFRDYTGQSDFWPRASHQKLIDAAKAAAPDLTNEERGRVRAVASHILATVIVRSPVPAVRAFTVVEAWLGDGLPRAEIEAKFNEAISRCLAK